MAPPTPAPAVPAPPAPKYGLRLHEAAIESLGKSGQLLLEAQKALDDHCPPQQHRHIAAHLRHVARFLVEVADLIDPTNATLILLEVPVGVLAQGWANVQAQLSADQQQIQQLQSQVPAPGSVAAQAIGLITDAADVSAAQAIAATPAPTTGGSSSGSSSSGSGQPSGGSTGSGTTAAV